MRRSIGLGLGVFLAAGVAVLLFVQLASDPKPPDPAAAASRAATRRPAAELRQEPEASSAPELTGAPGAVTQPRAPPQTEPEASSKPPDLTEAKAELHRLEALLRNPRALNEEIIAALHVVWGWYVDPRHPTGLILHAMPEAGTRDESTVAKANLQLLTQPEDVLALTPEERRFWRDVRKFREDVERAFVKAFGLVKVHASLNRNIRDDVNISAVRLLGDTGSPKASKSIRKVLEKKTFKATYEVSQAFLDAAFGALARLNDMDSFDWMTDEFTHSKLSPREEVHRLIAAHEALVQFRSVPAKRRYRLVREMVKVYSSVEAIVQLDRTRTDPQKGGYLFFWRRVGPGVLRVIEHYADSPRDAQGLEIRTMAGFLAWFREHKRSGEPPWKD